MHTWIRSGGRPAPDSQACQVSQLFRRLVPSDAAKACRDASIREKPPEAAKGVEKHSQLGLASYPREHVV